MKPQRFQQVSQSPAVTALQLPKHSGENGKNVSHLSAPVVG
jgi:hypothetical protein